MSCEHDQKVKAIHTICIAFHRCNSMTTKQSHQYKKKKKKEKCNTQIALLFISHMQKTMWSVISFGGIYKHIFHPNNSDCELLLFPRLGSSLIIYIFFFWLNNALFFIPWFILSKTFVLRVAVDPEPRHEAQINPAWNVNMHITHSFAPRGNFRELCFQF